MSNSERSVLVQEITWPEFAERIRSNIVILPVGSTEQHGHHLPLGTDVFQVEHAAREVAKRIGGLVAPAIPYGYRSAPKSGGGEIFPGTLSLSAQTMISVVTDVLTALIRQGARKIVVMDGHYENNMFLHEAVHLVLEKGLPDDLRIIKVTWVEAMTQETLNRAFPDGFPGWALEHAAHIETSAMLAIRPDLVQMDKVRPDRASDLPIYDIYPQPSDLVPKSGVLADPTRATSEIGNMIYDSSIEQLGLLLQKAFDQV